jgi:hypothetical protein
MLAEMTYAEVYSSSHVYLDTYLTCSQNLYIENHFKEHVMG